MTTLDASAPGGPYPVAITLDVHWGDMDAFGHVNNARYFTWFETCRSVYFGHIGLRVDKPSSPGPIIAHIACDYLMPVVYPATLAVGTRVDKIGNTSFTMTYGIFAKDAPPVLVARGTSVVVLFDYATGQKVAISDDLRTAIARVEGRSATRP